MQSGERGTESPLLLRNLCVCGGGVCQTFLEILVLLSYNIPVSQGKKTVRNNKICYDGDDYSYH